MAFFTNFINNQFGYKTIYDLEFIPQDARVQWREISSVRQPILVSTCIRRCQVVPISQKCCNRRYAFLLDVEGPQGCLEGGASYLLVAPDRKNYLNVLISIHRLTAIAKELDRLYDRARLRKKEEEEVEIEEDDMEWLDEILEEEKEFAEEKRETDHTPLAKYNQTHSRPSPPPQPVPAQGDRSPAAMMSQKRTVLKERETTFPVPECTPNTAAVKLTTNKVAATGTKPFTATPIDTSHTSQVQGEGEIVTPIESYWEGVTLPTTSTSAGDRTQSGNNHKKRIEVQTPTTFQWHASPSKQDYLQAVAQHLNFSSP